MNATPQLNEAAEGGSSPRSCSRSSMVNFIRRYNRWRRGDESLTMESPKAIGDALDAVCDTLDEHANEIKGWQNKWECAVEMAELITSDNIRLKCTLAKWYEWARMHGHLGHAEGIAAETQDALQSLPNDQIHPRRA